MMVPQQWEGVAQDRMRDWDKEMQYRQLLAHLPQQPPLWRRWTGGGLVWMGSRLMALGERVTPCECEECVTVAG